MLNGCDIREGTLSLADPVNWSQRHASSEESKGKHGKSNQLASWDHKSCKLSSIYGKFVIDKWLSWLVPAFPTYLQSPTANPLLHLYKHYFFQFSHILNLFTHILTVSEFSSKSNSSQPLNKIGHLSQFPVSPRYSHRERRSREKKYIFECRTCEL